MGQDLIEKADRLARLDNATNIRAWYDEFTGIMAARKHHSIIEGDDLDNVARQIVAVVEYAVDPADRLLAVAALGRLAAVARGREDKVFHYVDDVLEGLPPTLEVLADGDEREYAAVALRHTSAKWLLEYCLTESIDIDRSDKARKELLKTALMKLDNVSALLACLSGHSDPLREIESNE